jgi:hypothetical protein
MRAASPALSGFPGLRHNTIGGNRGADHTVARLETRFRVREHRAKKETSMARAADRDPRHHTQKMQKALKDIQDHLREDIEKVDEPQLKAMFETSAEVLGGLRKAFQDYERKNEAAWK